MLQNYGIVKPGNSSVRLIFFRTAFFEFYFQPNGLYHALFAILFHHQKNYGSRNQLLGKYDLS